MSAYHQDLVEWMKNHRVRVLEYYRNVINPCRRNIFYV